MSDPVTLPGGLTATPAPSEPTPTPSPTPEQTPATPPAAASEPPKEPESLLGGDKPAETPPPEPFDPEKLTLPEGFDRESPAFTDFTNLAKEAGLPVEVAQRLVDLNLKAVEQANEKILEGWKTQNDAWQAQVKADKDIGGDKLPDFLQKFSKVAGDPTLSDPEFRQALLYTGAGNHPAVVKTLVKWAAALSEGGPVQGGPPGQQPGRTLGDVMYPGGYTTTVRNQ